MSESRVYNDDGMLEKVVLRKILAEVPELAMYRVKFLATGQRQAFLQSLKELLQMNLGCVLDLVVINLEIVKGVREFRFEIFIVGAAKFHDRVLSQREF